MKSRLAWFLLALSLALNLSFVAGFFHVRNVLRQLETPGGRARWAADRLKLDRSQRGTFEQVTTERLEKLRALQRAHARELDAFWAEIVEDPRAARISLERLLEVQRTVTVQSVDDLRLILEVLSPEQRRALVRMIRDRNRL